MHPWHSWNNQSSWLSVNEDWNSFINHLMISIFRIRDLDLVMSWMLLCLHVDALDHCISDILMILCYTEIMDPFLHWSLSTSTNNNQKTQSCSSRLIIWMLLVTWMNEGVNETPPSSLWWWWWWRWWRAREEINQNDVQYMWRWRNFDSLAVSCSSSSYSSCVTLPLRIVCWSEWYVSVLMHMLLNPLPYQLIQHDAHQYR